MCVCVCVFFFIYDLAFSVLVFFNDVFFEKV